MSRTRPFAGRSIEAREEVFSVLHPSFIIIFITCWLRGCPQPRRRDSGCCLSCVSSAAGICPASPPAWVGQWCGEWWLCDSSEVSRLGKSSGDRTVRCPRPGLLGEPCAPRYSLRANFFGHNSSSLLLLKCKIGNWSQGRKSGELETRSLEAPCLLMRHEAPHSFVMQSSLPDEAGQLVFLGKTKWQP